MKIFHPAAREWFSSAFPAPTKAQQLEWPAIARGESTLILAPTGSGKTLAAFLWCLNRLMFTPPPEKASRCRVLYISPLKALAVDVERNLRVPLAGIANVARARGETVTMPEIAIRTGDTSALERARLLCARPVGSHHAGVALPAADVEFAERLATVIRSSSTDSRARPEQARAHLALSQETRAARGRLHSIDSLSHTTPLIARFLGGAEARTISKVAESSPPRTPGRAGTSTRSDSDSPSPRRRPQPATYRRSRSSIPPEEVAPCASNAPSRTWPGSPCPSICRAGPRRAAGAAVDLVGGSPVCWS
jgi:ATP-dependent Lhr-like helicase